MRTIEDISFDAAEEREITGNPDAENMLYRIVQLLEQIEENTRPKV